MIQRYNQSQTLKAVCLILAGICGCGLAYLFFRYVPVFFAWRLGKTLSPDIATGLGLVGLAASWFSGYRVWKARGGLYSYRESGLYHQLDTDSAGAYVVSNYAHRVTGCAYVIGQIFIAGPQCILRALSLLRSRIAYSDALESRLLLTLETLRAANKWQGFHDHPELREEIPYLAQMGLIDFSNHNGVPRFKAR